MENNKLKSGFVSLIGRPSSGKSSLINYICGFKISAVSRHPQTTQFIVRGIYNDNDSQVIFVDTPGYHHHDSKLNKGLSNLAVRTLDEGDLILYIVDLSREFGEEEEAIIGKLMNADQKIIIAYNKTDLNTSTAIENEIKLRLKNIISVKISAKTGENIDKLIQIIKENLPVGPLYYPEEYVTDQSIPFRIKEIVREKVFINTIEEVPHSVYVEIESLDINDKKISCHAVIYVEKDSQKGIIIGKKGTMIKKIGKEAREELMDIMEKKLDLFLKVKVHHKWKKKENFIKKRYKII